MWLVDFFLLRKNRIVELSEKERVSVAPLTKKEKKEILEPSGLWGSLVSCFPVLLIVFLVRSFAYEPFRIPSASMMPTLLRGDFILVEKFRYGIRNPFTNKEVYEISTPERGDVVVFKYPDNPNIDYIKRIIGLPGDKIKYNDGDFYIMPKGSSEYTLVTSEVSKEQLYTERNALYPSEAGIMGTENLLGYQHRIMRDPEVRPNEPFFKQRGEVIVGNVYGEWTVPEDNYFAIGDNREHSRDSRFWGFVPRDYLIGKAICIWMNFSTDKNIQIGRLGSIE